MAKEWILNIATNRWKLNQKSSVGPVSLWIRQCAPKDVEEWEKCYLEKLRSFLEEKGISLEPKAYLEELGRKLYVKITEVIQAEIEEITEQDCVAYIWKRTVYGQLQTLLGVKIYPAPDEWDRLYNVDFYIKAKKGIIGLQIKPISYEQTPEVHKWCEWLYASHKAFEDIFGGKVYVVFSVKRGRDKVIFNKQVIEEIRKEIERLGGIDAEG